MESLGNVLSVAIGISFVFLILSVLNSWVQEYIATLFSLRASYMADILQNMLEPDAQKLNGHKKAFQQQESPGTKKGEKDRLDIRQLDQDKPEKILERLKNNPVQLLYQHPIIFSLSKPNELPSYIPTRNFVSALLDLLNRAGQTASTSGEITMENVRRGIERLGGEGADEKSKQLMARLTALLNSAQLHQQSTSAKAAGARLDELESFRNTIAEWFEQTIERGIGWYKRRMQWIGIISGLTIAILLNMDTIGLATALWQNATLRDVVVQAANENIASTPTPAAGKTQGNQNLDQLKESGLPFGWLLCPTDGKIHDSRCVPTDFSGWIAKVIGLLLTGFAISQGSQIWFDFMGRLINLRTSGGTSDSRKESFNAPA